MYCRVLGILLICLVAVVIVTANAAATPNVEKTNRIVNGKSRTIEELPFIVQIRHPGVGTFCGGTLVSSQYVVTAAHCFAHPYNQTKALIVVGGASNRTQSGIQRKIVSLSIHPEYENIYADKGTIFEKQIGSIADVAVIKLDKPFTETGQIEVMQKLCSRVLSPEDFVEVAGWGHTQQINPHSTQDTEWKFSEQLQSVRLRVISNDQCSERLSGSGIKLSATNVCTFEKERDSCVSDSGGPVIRGGEFCAVVSYGLGCAYGEYPGVYTSYHSVRNFIDKIIEE